MKRLHVSARIVPVLAIFLVLKAASAQVSTGTPPFGSFGGGPFDVVNLGNLNVHLSIPILHKSGRGVPFSYDLSYDNSIWYAVTVNGQLKWQPTANWGWTSKSLAVLGYVGTETTMTQKPIKCVTGFGVLETDTTTYTYTDSAKRSHPFPGSTYQQNNSCNGAWSNGPTLTATTTDGSGYTLKAPANQVGDTVTTRSGVLVYTNVGSGGGNGTYQDTNGNQLTVNNSTGQFFDTLSSSTAVLTQAGSGTPSSPITYTYAAPSGSAAYTVKYAAYTVKTNFGFSTIGEYGPTSNNLVSEIDLPDGTKYTFQYEATPGYSGDVTGRLASVTLPTGGTITYTYNGGTNGTGIYSDGSTAGLNRILAASTTCNSGNGCWQYSRSLVSGTPAPGSTWQTTVIDPNSNYSVVNFAEDSVTGQLATWNLYETQRQIYQGPISPSNLLATTINCYNNNYANCSTATVSSPITQTDFYSQLPNGNTRLSETIYNGYGSVTDDKEYDYGVTMGSAPGTAHLVRETATTYASLGNGIVDHPATIVVYDWTSGTSKTASSATYTYDGSTVVSPSGTTPQHIAVSGSRGNLTTVATQVNSSTALYRKFTYYDTGKIQTATDAGATSSGGPNVTTYNYPDATSTCGNAFATTTTVPILGTTPVQTFNCTGAVATQTKDLNGNPTNITYSDTSFWRPASVSYPDGGQKSYTYGINPASVTVAAKINSASNLTGTTVFDSYGRISTREITSDPSGTDYIVTSYDNVGRVSSVTNPYRSTSDPTYGVTQYAYDALGRVTKVTNPDNTTVQTSYTGRAVQVQNEAGRIRISQSDGLGRLVSICEVTNTSQMGTAPGACSQDIPATGFLTSYGYDVLGNMTGVTQGSQARSYTYDELSRLTSEANPESGTTAYSYDSCSAGDLCSRTRPAPNQTGSGTVVASYIYDALHRNTGITYNDGTSPPVAFYYDQAGYSNPKGRLTYATTNGSNPGCTGVQLWYDSMGRLSQQQTSTPYNCGSSSFGTAYTYDYLGDVATSSNGAGVTLTYGYNNAAQLTGIISSLSDSNHPGTLLSGILYNAMGGPVSNTLGNGLAESWSYDTLGRTLGYASTGGPSGTYSFGNGITWVGSELRSAGDSITGNWSYSYDDFGRLSTATCSHPNCGNAAFSYAYDRFGNRWQQNVTAGSGPSPQYSFDAHNHIVGITYDSAGNIINDGVHSYTYDPENRLTKVDGGSTATYVYDAFGRRVQNVGGENWIYDSAGHRITGVNNSGGWDVGEIYAGSRHLATYANGTTYFTLNDWLGTRRMTTDVNKNIVGTCYNLPFGDGRNCTGSIWDPMQFTGFINDSETGLDHTQFRQYSSTQGHWTTPDPSGIGAVDPTNPQTWNRYAYVGNNPMVRTDRFGLDDGCGGDDVEYVMDLREKEREHDPYARYRLDLHERKGDDSYDCLNADGGSSGGGASIGGDPTPPTEDFWGSNYVVVSATVPDINVIPSQIQQMMLQAPNPDAAFLNYLRDCEGHAPGGGFGAYNDAPTNGNCTIGYGHLLHLGPCTAQDRANHAGETQQQADAQLQQDYNDARNWVNTHAPGLDAGQTNTLVDLYFNMGQRLENHDVWTDVTGGNLNNVPGDIMTLRAGPPGIATRRQNEVNMWNNGAIPAQCY